MKINLCFFDGTFLCVFDDTVMMRHPFDSTRIVASDFGNMCALICISIFVGGMFVFRKLHIYTRASLKAKSNFSILH